MELVSVLLLYKYSRVIQDPMRPLLDLCVPYAWIRDDDTELWTLFI